MALREDQGHVQPTPKSVRDGDSLDAAFQKIRDRAVGEITAELSLSTEEYSDQLTRRITEIGGSVANGLSLTDTSGQRENLRQTQRREVTNLLAEEGDTPVWIPTGSGGVVPHSREILTDDIMGCLGVYIQGPKGKALVHMTPTTQLPYEKPMLAQSVQTIMERSRQLADDLDDLQLVIIANLVDDRVSQERHAEWEAVKDAFAEQGVQKAKVVEVPLEHTAVYHTPERPDELMVIGIRRFINDAGLIDDAGRYYVRNHWIPIDTTTNVHLETQITAEDRKKQAEVRASWPGRV